MKSFFQTFKQRNLLSASRIAGKKLSASVPLLFAALMTMVFYSCQDEFDLLPPANVSEQGSNTRSDGENTGLEALTSPAYGYYKPNRCIPLVGVGRVINFISNSLISVIGDNNNIECLIDDDIETNAVTVSGLVSVNAGVPIFSVRDVNRIYYATETEKIKVGFVYNPGESVLDLSVLKSFYIQTLLKGEVQESSLDESGGSISLLDLNLLNVAGGMSEIAFKASKPFDEVRLGYAGVNITVTNNSVRFYYAFVGENPEKKATTETDGYYTSAETYPGISLGPLGQNVGNTFSLIDGNPDNSESLSIKKTELYVDFNQKVKEGSEIGFRTGGFTTLDIDLTGLYLYQLNAQDQWNNETQLSGGIGVSLIKDENGSTSTIATGECYGIKIVLKTGVVGGLLDTLLGLLGKTKFYYAYSRDPVTVDPSAYFTIGNDVTYNDYYDLPQPKEGSVSYTVTSSSGANPSVTDYRRITGMKPGDYIVKADYTKDGETIISYAVITCKKIDVIPDCNTKMINDGTTSQYKVVDPGTLGGISLFNKINNTDKLVDTDAENYAEATNALSLLQFGGLIGVESTQDISKPNDGMTRVGFVMQTNKQLLGADVLKYFYIVLYKDGKVVDEGISQQNKTVGVGLIGNNGDKLRFYMETKETFDRVELWTAGLLNVSLSTFRLYYAFYESTECDNNSATSEACMEVISAQNHGAKINYAETKLPSAVSVGSVMDNLSYVIDNSLETSATIIKGISLVDRTTVAVKFDYVNGGAVGAVLRSTPNVLDVTALQNITVTAYNNGNAVTSEATSSGLVSIDLISDSGLAYLEINPELGFDEVRISFPSLANIADNVFLAGFYIRPDTDRDGIPDCAEDPNDQEGDDGFLNPEIEIEHVCISPDTYQGTIRINVLASDNAIGKEVDFTCYPYNGNGQKVERTVALNKDNNGYYFKLSLPIGYYSISGLPYNGLRAQVHPLKTTWKRNPEDTDWNNWNNWTDGSPWGCTNVVIPTGATRYPVLESWSSIDEFYGGNYCENIHFEPGAAVLNTQYLEYDCAYVEMEVTAGEYHMISTPLHGMVTGDMFVSPEMPAYFTPLKEDTYREVRHNPIVRQKMYSRAVTTATSGTDLNGTVASTADWSRTFNAVAQLYEQAQGIKMMVGNEGDGTSYRLRFPKAYNEYNYYTLSGGWVKKETFPEGARNMNGRFAYEESGFKPENAGRSFTFTLNNEDSAAEYFVAGNPFMSYIDVQTFLSNNTGVSAIKFGETDEIINSSNANGTQIAPMQAFYVVANAASNLKELSITYTQDMFVQPSASTATRSSRSVSAPSASEMKISATSEGTVSTCLLTLSAEASDSYSAKEDVVSLIDEDFMPKVKVYTVADKRALDIQKMNNAKHVDLGFVVKDGTQNAEITLNYGSNWKGWTLVDKQTGNRYELNGNTVSVNAGALKSNDSRFYLEKQ